MRLLSLLAYLFLVTLVTSCSGSTEDKATEPEPGSDYTSSGLTVSNLQDAQHYKVLFFGNSHVGKLPLFISQLIESGLPHKSLTTKGTPNALYLDERLHDTASLEALESEQWTHVIFQAQKYSQSGTVEHSTHAAKVWITRAKQIKATPILFPEHPQAGDIDEGIRVYELHQTISADEPSCVAPIGHVWKKILTLRPELSLYEADGNHANTQGQLLTSMIFYEIITGESADLLPFISEIEVDIDTQALMGQMVSEILTEMPACEF
ncbi:hypothetical protein AADZ84_12590 [Colwelliaceae bacterium MEBiC 14330]